MRNADFVRYGFNLLFFKSENIDCVFVNAGQSFVDVLKLIFFNIKKAIVAHQVENDLGHAARLTVLCALKDDILHLAAAQTFSPLFAQHPRDRVRHVGLAAAVRADDRRDAVAGKHDLRIVGKRLESGYF